MNTITHVVKSGTRFALHPDERVIFIAPKIRGCYWLHPDGTIENSSFTWDTKTVKNEIALYTANEILKGEIVIQVLSKFEVGDVITTLDRCCGVVTETLPLTVRFVNGFVNKNMVEEDCNFVVDPVYLVHQCDKARYWIVYQDGTIKGHMPTCHSPVTCHVRDFTMDGLRAVSKAEALQHIGNPKTCFYSRNDKTRYFYVDAESITWVVYPNGTTAKYDCKIEWLASNYTTATEQECQDWIKPKIRYFVNKERILIWYLQGKKQWCKSRHEMFTKVTPSYDNLFDGQYTEVDSEQAAKDHILGYGFKIGDTVRATGTDCHGVQYTNVVGIMVDNHCSMQSSHTVGLKIGDASLTRHFRPQDCTKVEPFKNGECLINPETGCAAAGSPRHTSRPDLKWRLATDQEIFEYYSKATNANLLIGTVRKFMAEIYGDNNA